MVLAHAVSDAGPVRKNNEDSCAVEHDLQVYVVADGMGGHNAGEVASRLAVEALVGFMRRSHEDTDVSWPYGIDPDDLAPRQPPADGDQPRQPARLPGGREP